MTELAKRIDIIGADVGSTHIVIAWADASRPVQTIANNRRAILAWLKHVPVETVIGMEATGHYHQLLADCAAARGHVVYVVNPKHLANYAKGVGQRGKTDPLDAQTIARYIDRERDQLYPYRVPTACQRTLRQLLSERVSVVKHGQAIRQSLKATGMAGSNVLKDARQQTLQQLQVLIDTLDAELKQVMAANAALEAKRLRLQTIVGVGFLNSIALTHRLDRTPFANSDALVAAYGLDPRPKESGHRVGKRKLTKEGNPEDRRLIYLAAQSAVKTKTFNPLYQTLLAKGFKTTQAIVIIARKLLRIAFAIWTSNSSFDPTQIGKQGCKKP